MSGHFLIADKEPARAKEVGNAVVERAKEIAIARMCDYPTKVTVTAHDGNWIMIVYNTNAFRDCLEAAITEQGHAILGRCHAGVFSGPAYDRIPAT